MSEAAADDQGGRGRDPRQGRQRFLVRFLQASLGVVLTLAMVALVVPERWEVKVATAALVVLIAAPLARVAWLGVRWIRVGDYRFAAVAGALLAVATLALVV